MYICHNFINVNPINDLNLSDSKSIRLLTAAVNIMLILVYQSTSLSLNESIRMINCLSNLIKRRNKMMKL